jgi:uncharacterized membrane protein SpoIIM required for sporulation
MLESLINPKKAERRPYEMFFVGFVYSSVAFFLFAFVFINDVSLRDVGGWLIVTLTVVCCLPFMYYLIKYEEEKDIEITKSGKLIAEHTKALKALMWMFLGFVVGFGLWYIVFPEKSAAAFNTQISTFCHINNPTNVEGCVQSFGNDQITGKATSLGVFFQIFSNNIYVLIVTLVFSVLLGAGAIFILVWNATVIATAVGHFARGSLSSFPSALFRYLFHGIPEMAAYFTAALAGGIISVAIIRKDLEGDRKWRILQDALLLLIIAILIILASAILEVYITPLFF